MAKRRRKMTPGQSRRRRRIAKRLKGKPGIRNPFAVATAAATGTTRRRRRSTGGVRRRR